LSRFADLIEDVFSIFAQDSWAQERIRIFPLGVVPKEFPPEYLIMTLLSTGETLNRASLSGLLLLDGFTQIKAAPTRIMAVADKLDTFLVHKSFSTGSGVTQFGIATMEDRGIDRNKSGLHRFLYSIPFNHFGVA
jgi:hypothetical protein